jgi:uridylate kinase
MEVVVISLGGSIIVPDEVDFDFLSKFKKIILDIAKKKKVAICTGGGKTARKYIQGLEKINATKHERDWIGIETTRLNAKLVSSFLLGHQDIPYTLEELKEVLKNKRIVICGGLRPGITSDGTTAQIARFLKVDSLINITNVKGLYNKDPKKYKDAKFIPKIFYKDFEKMMEKIKEKPGQHFILDSLATKIISESKIRAIILNSNINNLKKCIEGKPFIGTIISDN